MRDNAVKGPSQLYLSNNITDLVCCKPAYTQSVFVIPTQLRRCSAKSKVSILVRMCAQKYQLSQSMLNGQGLPTRCISDVNETLWKCSVVKYECY